MSEPTRTEILDHVSAHFGISRIRVLEIFKTPTHPAEMKDTFAALAMQGMIAKGEFVGNPQGLSHCSYLIADQMLVERAK